MRYRPFNQAGLAVSAITLALDDAPLQDAERRALVFGALEAGINSFELDSPSANWTTVLRAAVEAAGRNVLVLTLKTANPERADPNSSRAGLALQGEVLACLGQIGVDRFDAVLLDDDGSSSPPNASTLHALREQGLAGMVGVTCGRDGPNLELIQAGYDLLATPFGLRADAGLRKRLRIAGESNITLIGFDVYDAVADPVLAAAAPKGLSRLFKRPAAVATDAGPYEFLHRIPGWTAEEVALAYALTEPTLATIRVQITNLTTLDRLAKAVERELPTGAAAQIEMARFSTPA